MAHSVRCCGRAGTGPCCRKEQLAARAGLGERTVRDLEADRVLSPRPDTVRLLADALQLTEPQRGSWFAAAWGEITSGRGPRDPEQAARRACPAMPRPVAGCVRLRHGQRPRAPLAARRGAFGRDRGTVPV